MDIAKRAAEHFGSREHDWKVYSEIDICHKCGCKGYNTSPCPIPNPIDITDLGKALECFRGLLNPRGAMALVKYIEKLLPDEWKVYTDSTKQLPVILTWFAFHATAEQIWEICILAKESEK